MNTTRAGDERRDGTQAFRINSAQRIFKCLRVA
jgi:hypothetical protein